MKEIVSADNQKVKKLAALFQKRQRDKQGRYIIEGPNLLREALKNGAAPESVFFRSSSFPGEEYAQLANLLKEASVRERTRPGGAEADCRGKAEAETGPETVLLRDEIFDRIAPTDTPQGVMAVVRKRRWSEGELFGAGDGREGGGTGPPGGGRGGNILVLDRLQDPGNLGTILRTADGAGFSGALLMKGCGDLYSPKVVRACTGTLFRLPVLFCGSPREALELLHRYHKKVYATSLFGSKIYYECDLREDTALIVGNEGNGVCDEFLSGADGLLTIPMAGNLESLNAAVAAGILMYETVRQRNGG